jgi:hypothetical protein
MMMQVWKSTTQPCLSNGQLHPDAFTFITHIPLLR